MCIMLMESGLHFAFPLIQKNTLTLANVSMLELHLQTALKRIYQMLMVSYVMRKPNKKFQPTFDCVTFLLPQKRAAVKRR